MNEPTPKVKKMLSGIAKRIAEIRGDRSQRRFAQDLGVFQQNVNRYENGTAPCVAFLCQLGTVEKVNLDWLLTGRGKPKLRKVSG